VSDLVCRDYRLFRGEVRIPFGDATEADGREPMPASGRLSQPLIGEGIANKLSRNQFHDR
jgi:hypothetical protein